MADIPVTPTTLVAEVASASIVDAGQTSIANPANVWAIAVGGKPGDRILLKFLCVTGCNITILAGDRPPSQRSGLGTYVFPMTAAQVMYLMVDVGRHLQDDGTIRVMCSQADATCKAFILPKFF